MEQLILEIETYCLSQDAVPQKLLRDVISAKWGTWQTWKDGTSSPTMRTADRIRAHMLENPPQPAACAAKSPESTA